MHDANIAAATTDVGQPHTAPALELEKEVVSTHVLVEAERVEKLRELSKRTRVAQSEYLREAVDDLLQKYHKLAEEP
jgi:hypothetical protein